MAEYNGGFKSYSDRITPKTFYRSDDRFSRTGVVAGGQVLKQFTFLQTDNTGKLIAHTGLNESTIVRFTSGLVATTGTSVLGGLTFTAGSAGTTIAQLVTAWSTITDGTTAATANTALLAAGIPTTVGIFSGTMTGWNSSYYAADSITFTSTLGLAATTDLALTGSGTGTLSKVDSTLTFAPIAGVTMYDVYAKDGSGTSKDTTVEIYSEASFWASALTWLVNPLTDTITLPDGTTVLCTAYNTGTIGVSSVATRMLQQKFVEGSEFTELGFLNVGDNA